MTRAGAAQFLYGGCLLTLPLIGCDPVRLASGADLGAGFQPAYLFLAGATLLACAATGRRRLWAGWAAARPWSTLGLWAAGAVAVSALGLVIRPPAGGPEAAARLWRLGKQFGQLLIMFTFVAWPLLWTRGSARWEWTRRLFGLALLGQLLYGLVQGALFGHACAPFAALERVFTANPAILSGSEELYLGHGFTGIPRLRGTCCEPLYLGNYLLLALPVVLLPGARHRHQALALGGGLLLLLTWSRGAWLAAGGAAVVWALLAARAGPRRRPEAGTESPRRWLIVAALSGMAVALLLWRPDLVTLPARRLAQSVNREDWSNLTRLYSMQAAWRAFLLSPVVGVGWGQFGFHFVGLVDPLGLQSQFSWPVVNSYPLQVLCETGLIGFAVFVGGAALVARAIARALGGGGGVAGVEARRRTALLAAALVGVWGQLLTFSQYNLPHIWVALGLLLAATREAEAGRG